MSGTCGCERPPGGLCAHQLQAVAAEAQQRGSVAWQDSQRGGPGYYRWTLLGETGTVTGLADSEAEAWRTIHERVASSYRSVRRLQPRHEA